MILGSQMVSAGTNGYLLNCFCAKSYARGGTVVAIPDNSSVILANPAGLAFMERRAVGIGLGLLIPKVQFENGLNSNVTAKDKMYPMPFSGYVDPRPGSKWAWGFGLNVVGGMGAEYNLDHDIFRNYDPTSANYGQLVKQNYFSKFGYVKAGPAAAYRINENFSIGAGVQLYYGMLDFRMPFSIEPVANLQGNPINNPNMTFGQMFAAPTNQGGFGYNEVTAYADMHDLAGFGVGANIGLFYKINDQWSVGLAYTAPTTMYLEGKAEMDMTAQLNKAFGDAVAGAMAQGMTQEQAQAAVAQNFASMGIDLNAGVATSYSKNKADFDVPQKIAAGVSFKPTPRWTFGVDVEYIDWKNAFDNLPINLSGSENANINLMINGDTQDGTFEYKFPLNWKNAVNMKFGVDYLLREGINLRSGYIHGANPVPASTVFSIFPAIVEDHITLGGGYTFNKRFTLDVAYIYSLNKKLNGSSAGHLIGNEYDGSTDQLQEQLIVTSLSIGL
jgi:long-chain fatty acid transport protein